MNTTITHITITQTYTSLDRGISVIANEGLQKEFLFNQNSLRIHIC